MRILYIVLGCLSLGLGAVGAVLPILPTTPFLMAAAFCFARGSQRLNTWFLGTRLYKNYLESFVKSRGMTLKTKLSVMGCVTAVMAVGFLCMKAAPVGRVVLAAVWVGHVLYFALRVKTLKEPKKSTEQSLPRQGAGARPGEEGAA